ncbi:MAG: putative bifunctional diguanylate cyclase/phosphodiesterase, partial [Janthinobacterium lividum]
MLVNEAMQRALGLTRVDPLCPASTMLASSRWLGSNSSERLLNLLRGELEGPITVDGRDGTAFTASSRVDVDGNVFLSLVPTGPTAPPPAHSDPLTGLADRTAFQDRLNRLCAVPESPVAVMLIDLDRFKAVNDTLGHPAGDQLLKLVAQRLRGTLRHADVVSRLGGDEFAVAMVGADDAQVAAERLVDVLSRPYLVERHFAVIGASIGLAISTPGGTGADALIRAADLALYQAKANGRGVVCVFNEEMDRRARNRNALADDLRRAIPLQQLELHFQPQICLQTTELNGFESLVRWNHPTLGLLGPDKFIPLAEEMGLILPLGEWVLGEACRQAASWSDPVSVAVNVSPKQLLDRKRLIHVIAAALANTGLPAHRLEIEITETALVN